MVEQKKKKETIYINDKLTEGEKNLFFLNFILLFHVSSEKLRAMDSSTSAAGW